LIQAATKLPGNSFHITVSGDTAEAILLHTPSNKFVLINGMKDGSALRSFLDERLPFYDRIPDMILVQPSSISPDSLVGIPITKVKGEIYITGQIQSDTLHTWIDSGNGDTFSMNIGDQLDLGSGIILSILETGEKSSLTQISLGDYRINIGFGELKHPGLCMANILISDQGHTECANTQLLVTPARDWKSGNHIDISSMDWVKLAIQDDSLFISAPKGTK
jgi:hypothetical protein